MNYQNTIQGHFVDRPNRFIAHVEIEGIIETVHVKNTGRCKELLIPGKRVLLEISDKKERKTKYDLVMVEKDGIGWVNLDSQAANKIAREWLDMQNFTCIRPEYSYGESRIDFYMEKESRNI